MLSTYWGIVLCTIIYITNAAPADDGCSGNQNFEEEVHQQDPVQPIRRRYNEYIMGSFQNSAVASNCKKCAQIGKHIMEKGGGAIDAAIATLICEGATGINNMGVGGGFLMTYYKADEKKAYSLIAREQAPLTASRDMYKCDQKTLTGKEFEECSSRSSFGAGAVAIPGEVKGYEEAYNKWGNKDKIKWSDLFSETISMLETGSIVEKHLAVGIRRYEKLIRKSPTLRCVLTKDSKITERDGIGADKLVDKCLEKKECYGELLGHGDTLKLEKLKNTLTQIGAEGADAFYKGSIGKSIIQDIKEAGGKLTMDDLASYQVKFTDPVEATLSSNMKIYTAPPPGSGALYAFMLRVLDKFNKDGKLPAVKNSDDFTIDDIQRITETFKYAYGQRTRLGDITDLTRANVTEVLNKLSSDEFVNEVVNKINIDSTYHKTSDYGADYEQANDHGTANIVVLDPQGNAVAVTSTVNLAFGSKFVSKTTGVLLNNQMDDFSTPGLTNFFGVKPSPTNYIEPGKRPMSSMCPSIIVKPDGTVKMVIGAAGGTRITTSSTLVSTRVLWFNNSMKKAMDSPRFHHQLLPHVWSYEYGQLADHVCQMVKIGHTPSQEVTSLLGDATKTSVVTGIQVDDDGKVQAYFDPRHPGSVDGL